MLRHTVFQESPTHMHVQVRRLMPESGSQLLFNLMPPDLCHKGMKIYLLPHADGYFLHLPGGISFGFSLNLG